MAKAVFNPDLSHIRVLLSLKGGFGPARASVPSATGQQSLSLFLLQAREGMGPGRVPGEQEAIGVIGGIA